MTLPLPPIPHGSDTEKAIVGRLVTDILANSMSITIWNGGDEPELRDSTNADEIFAALAASDEDELTMDYIEGGYAGWIRLVWGNDFHIISDYSVRLETVIAGADQLADDFENGIEPFAVEMPEPDDVPHNEHEWTRHYWLEGKALSKTTPVSVTPLAAARDV
jgi:hypothetical protein